MPWLRAFLRYWLVVVLWMAVIFSASSDRLSFQHSSRLFAPLIRWLFPHLSEQGVETGVFVLRKCAHLMEFAVLALLLWRALRRPRRADPRPWDWRKAGTALLLVAAYAATDEFHQLFVPTRQASFIDVLIDSTGALLALLFLWAIGRWRRWW